jgi:hypothetical protein
LYEELVSKLSKDGVERSANQISMTIGFSCRRRSEPSISEIPPVAEVEVAHDVEA